MKQSRESRQFGRQWRSRKSRSGAILVAVLTCLLVATALVAGALRSSVTARRESKLELQMQQTLQLLDAGVKRYQSASPEDQSAMLDGQIWDVHAVFANHTLGEVRYQRTAADNSATVHCTARIGQAAAANTITQLTRVIE